MGNSIGLHLCPEQIVFGLDIGTRSIVGTVGYKQDEHHFIVVAQSIRYHETRAMLDGQIHDIGRVSETIIEVKRDLEKQIGRKLNEVCIAAAGRVLKTSVTKAVYELGEERMITEEDIHALELSGIEKNYSLLSGQEIEGMHFYCVGYTVIHYYLNDYMITKLLGHKGNRISAEVLATFLPEEVIEGLYTAVSKAGLTVANLTLEPIAAINVAIPERFRLLNIALVDVGAGTSDISITRDGSIVAYGMIAKAGDEITDTIAKHFLVDFKTAEMIKMGSNKKKSITYKDIIGIPHKIFPKEIQEATQTVTEDITKSIAQRIIELNGDKSVSAVFVVGGGGKIASFTSQLATHLDLPAERVALRGEEVLGDVTFLDASIKKDPLLVTPIGICLNYYEQRNNFIFVQVNGEQVKLYDNARLTVMDAAMAIGYPNEALFPRRGAALNFELNGNKRMIRGEHGEPAEIWINGKPSYMNAAITANDIIKIKESTIGADAYYEINMLPEYHGTITFIVNNKELICQKFIDVNGAYVSEFYNIKDGDKLEILNYYTLEQLLLFMDLPYKDGILMNHVAASKEDRVYEKFTIEYNMEDEMTKDTMTVEDEIVEAANQAIGIEVLVNGEKVKLDGKNKYIVVDVLDVYSFDLSSPRGEWLSILCNGVKAEFSSPLCNGDVIKLFWQ